MIQITLVGAAFAALGVGPPPAPALTPTTEAPVSLTLGEALAEAENAPVARVIALELERARADADQAGRWPNPELSIWREEVAGVVEGFAQASVPLPVSGRLDLERRAAAAARSAAEARAGHARRLVQARVHEAFILLLAAQRRYEALAGSEARVGEFLAVLVTRETAGESSGFDRMRVARQHALLRARLGGAEGELARERLTLAAMLGRPGSGLVAVGDLGSFEPALPSFEEARRLAAGRPDLGALSLEATSTELRAEAAGRRRVPEPALLVGAKKLEARGEDDIGPVFGLSMTLPVADHGQFLRRAATAEAEALRLDLARREAEAAAEAEGTLIRVRTARAAETALRTGVENDPIVAIATALYDEGELSIHELLDAHLGALETELTLVDTSRTARLAEVELDRILGRGVRP